MLFQSIHAFTLNITNRGQVAPLFGVETVYFVHCSERDRTLAYRAESYGRRTVFIGFAIRNSQKRCCKNLAILPKNPYIINITLFLTHFL